MQSETKNRSLSMKTVLRLAVILSALLIAGVAVAADFSVKDSNLLLGDKVIEEANIEKVIGSDLIFTTVTGEAAQKSKIKDSVLIFDAVGKKVAEFPFAEAELLTTMFLSPEKNIVALGLAPDMQGVFKFYSYPDFKPLGKQLDYLGWENAPDLVWVNNNTILFHRPDDMTDERKCEYDPCVAPSVMLYNLNNGTEKMLFESSGKCNFAIKELQGKTLSVVKTCLAKPLDWKNIPEEVPSETLTTDLP